MLTMSLSIVFYFSFLLMPVALKGTYMEYITRKMKIMNYPKILVLIGLPVYLIYKSLPQTPIFDRNPYGSMSGQGWAIKEWSYDYNLYQNVRTLKEKYDNHYLGKYKEARKSFDDRRLPNIYPYYVKYFRNYPEDCYSL